MVAITAHFDGHVFVPDEPVRLRPGDRVLVQQLEQPKDTAAPDTSFLRKLNINLDARAVQEIIDDPELRLENL